MNIIKSPNLIGFNDLEQNLTERDVSHLSNFKEIRSDIVENLYLIVVSLVPLLFYALFYGAAHKEYNMAYGIFANPDVILLSIPYIIHCMLMISSKDGLSMKKPLMGWYFLLIIVSILVYFLLKLYGIEIKWIQIAVTWVFFCAIIVSGIIGSLASCLKKEEDK